jgi:hypothetical protein
MQRLRFAILAGLLCHASTASAEIRLTMAEGRVTISASNATVSQILAEWARVGQTRIVNGERLAGAPMTLELKNVPEAEALDILLRNAGGYLLAPRAETSPSASRFDRVLILPSSSTPRAAAGPPPTFFPRITPTPVSNGDEEPSPQVDRPGFVTFPQPIQPQSNPVPPPPEGSTTAPPSRTITSPIGVARPGMPVPAPVQSRPPVPDPQ